MNNQHHQSARDFAQFFGDSFLKHCHDHSGIKYNHIKITFDKDANITYEVQDQISVTNNGIKTLEINMPR